MFKEFKKFAMRGNVLDMAVGIIIGAAFTTIVNSLVKDIINPPIGLLIGGLDLSGYVWILKSATANSPAVTLNYGAFFNAIINFLIVAFSVFLLIKGVNRWRGLEKQKDTPKEKSCPYCTMPIPLKATRCPNCTGTIDN